MTMFRAGSMELNEFDDFDREFDNFRKEFPRPEEDGPPRPPLETYEADLDTEKGPDERYGFPPRNEQFRELTPEEVANIPAISFPSWEEKDLSKIPVPQPVYGDVYVRGYTSLTVAPPKLGKSLIGLAEAMDIATGRGFLTGVKREPQRVVYYNAEDDQDVIDSRVAALLTYYDVPQSEIVRRLFPVSGVPLDDFFMVSGQEGIINERLFIGLEKFCAEYKADVLIFDPLQDLSRSPETNEVYRSLGQRLRRFASKMNVALGLIHHTRKLAPGQLPSMDDMRGGGALRGTSRYNRILVGMTEVEAAKAGVPNHRYFFRVADAEGNLVPPSSAVGQWFQKVSVLTPNGQYVGAVAPWSWPDAFADISIQQASDARRAVMARKEPPRANPQATDWVGHLIGEVLGIDSREESGKARVKAIIKDWIASDVLREESASSRRDGRNVPIIVAGENDPAEVGS